MSRTINYDTPAADALFLEGTITSPSITQATPVTFRVPMVKTSEGVNDLTATLALVTEMEDRVDEDIASGLILGRVPMDYPD